VSEPADEFDDILPAALAGERLDRVVALVADLSRKEAVELIADGHVQVNGSVPAKPSVRVDADDRLRFRIPSRPEGIVADPSVEVPVVHRDEAVLVVNKPPHLVVHPGSGVETGTMVQGLLATHPELAAVGEPDRPGIVHRLDKGTSGLLVVARTPVAYATLTEQLAHRTVTRRYLAMVQGAVESEEGLIDAPLGRSPRQPTRRAVVADGRPARTRYRVAQRDPDQRWSLVWCRLETGRTHQIRAHLEAIGHPVAGDVQYGAESGRTFGLDRPFLHAAHLAFDHPTTGERLRFDAPVPDDLARVLTRLGLTVPLPPDGE
jgi:23S rRNA pseudouridine1911/1915/1917 synthase